MRLNLTDIAELPENSHSFFLLPERRVQIRSDLHLSYRECGQGQPVVLLHGLWSSAYSFRDLIDPLSAKVRVILPELFNANGADTLPGMDYRPQRLAELLLQFCQKLDLGVPLLVGHAESGLAGLHIAANQPESMRGLLAISPTLEPTLKSRVKSWWHSRSHSKRWAQANFNKPILAALGMLDYSAARFTSRQELRHLARGWSTQKAAQARARMLNQTLSSTYTEALLKDDLSKAKIPIKLVFGSSDTKGSINQGKQLKRAINGSEILVAEGCGASVQVENPTWLLQQIYAIDN